VPSSLYSTLLASAQQMRTLVLQSLDHPIFLGLLFFVRLFLVNDLVLLLLQNVIGHLELGLKDHEVVVQKISEQNLGEAINPFK
jgi:hypothetical protein